MRARSGLRWRLYQQWLWLRLVWISPRPRS